MPDAFSHLSELSLPQHLEEAEVFPGELGDGQLQGQEQLRVGDRVHAAARRSLQPTQHTDMSNTGNRNGVI